MLVICLFPWIIEIVQTSGKRNMRLLSVQRISINIKLPGHNAVVIVLVLLLLYLFFSFKIHTIAILCNILRKEASIYYHLRQEI